MNANYRKILSAAAPEDFVGRNAETEMLRRHLAGENRSKALLVVSAPVTGASELLKQFYDRLFDERTPTIPIYFAAEKSDASAANCARRFLRNFIQQSVAFHLHDAAINDDAFSIGELTELAAGIEWLAPLIGIYQTANRTDDDRALIRSRLGAPLRRVNGDAAFFVIFDDLHETAYFAGETNFVEELKTVFSRSAAPFVFGGNRRFLLTAARTGSAKLTGAKILPIEPLNFADAGVLAEKLAARSAVEINEPTRDLIAVKFRGNPTFIRYLIEAASEKNLPLDSFRRAEQLYADEIFGGRIGKFYDAVLHRIAPGDEIQREIIELFQRALNVENERPAIENRLEIGEADARKNRRITTLLNTAEIIRLSSGRAEAMSENEVLNDYMTARFRLEIRLDARAAVGGEMVSEFLKRAPQTMAKFYRQTAAIKLRELLAVFNRQEIPRALLDYAAYQKWLEKSESIADLLAEPEKITLPQVVYAAHTAAFYPPFEQLTDNIRSAVAFGFAEKIYTAADETVWLAAEIDSKLEASATLTEFWCDRLEMAAVSCDFRDYRIWLIAPEGFAPEALEILRQRSGCGSSRRQVELLTEFLNGEPRFVEKTGIAEYETVVPMGDDSELIAAAAAEEIARRWRFAPKAINQIKTAVVEACINASEHSLSVERKIYQQISVGTNKITITVSNRGLRLADRKIIEPVFEENRRGWGLKLIKTLMDEVKYEQVDDGTRISMTKYLT